MNNQTISRRNWLGKLAGVGALTLVPAIGHSKDASSLKQQHMASFSYCLNTSTIMGQQLKLEEEIEIAAKAGYDGVEIWINRLNAYVESGKSLKELYKRIQDWGIQVENAIGFAAWIVDNNDQRSKALEQAKQEMDALAQLGCKRIAAPPFGATEVGGLDLDKAAERFRALLDLGTQMGVMPQLEVWGFSKNLHKLSQVMYVAAEAGHPGARILPDVYHLYKGGSDFDGLKLLSGQTTEIFHMNDYPDLPQATIADKDRVYPGDGIAPVTEVLRDLQNAGGKTVLSLELFNRDLWEQDPMEVAKTGLQKMKSSVGKL